MQAFQTRKVYQVTYPHILGIPVQKHCAEGELHQINSLLKNIKGRVNTDLVSNAKDGQRRPVEFPVRKALKHDVR